MISVILVTHNSRAVIGRCLDSLETTGAEVVVVDNASADGTANRIEERYPAVKLLRCNLNLGFAAAANLGARHSRGTALLFLNPDTACLGPLESLERALESSEKIAAVAPRLVNGRGQTQIGFNVRRLPTLLSLLFEVLLLNRLFPNNPVNRKYRCLGLDHERPTEVEQPAGACLLVRRRHWDRSGGFDEAFYPLWFEDVDLCKRLRDAGGTILFWPLVSFEHQGGHSLESLTFSERQIYWYRNLLYYVQKHFPSRTRVLLRGALICGMGLRIAAASLGGRGTAPASQPDRGERVRAYWNAAKLSFWGGGSPCRASRDFLPGWPKSVKRG